MHPFQKFLNLISLSPSKQHLAITELDTPSRINIHIPGSRTASFQSKLKTFIRYGNRLFGVFDFRNIHGCSDIAFKYPAFRKARSASIKDPAIFSVMTFQPVLHAKSLARVE